MTCALSIPAQLHPTYYPEMRYLLTQLLKSLCIKRYSMARNPRSLLTTTVAEHCFIVERPGSTTLELYYI